MNTPATTVNEKIQQWQDLHTLGRKPSTRRFNREVTNFVRDVWQRLDQPADSVTWDDVALVAKECEDYCPSRWNGVISILRHITPLANQLKRKPIRFRQFNPPSREEIQDLLRELDLTPTSNARWIVRLLMLTGMRHNEAKHLKWAHVLKDRIEVVAENSKNGRRRSIPMLAGVREVLEQLRGCKSRSHYHRKPAPDRSEYVLPDLCCKTAVRNACMRLGMQNLSPHCWRHLFITRLVESGVAIPVIARWVGHSDGGSLLARMYYHLLPEHEREMAKKASIF